jgi:glycosyltransferase involved in cell wall biosynthesis
MTRALFVVGALPPPVNGYAFVTRAFADLAKGVRPVTCFDTSPGKFARGVAYHLRRSSRLVRAFAGLFASSERAQAELYCPVESGMGLVYTIFLCMTGRLLRLPVLLHHHSFRYIDRRSRLMAIVVRLSNAGVTHVFLCGAMQAKFARLYPRPIKSRVLTNAGFIETAPAGPFDETRPLTVGFLSNLNAEKGLFRFLAVAEAIQKAGIAARFILAGPPAGADEAAAILSSAGALGDSFEYRGAVYDDDKTRFYADIDVFLFPSLYRNEAQPLVLFEAMLSGSLVIAFDRGCISQQVGDRGWVLDESANFISAAVAHLRRLAADRRALNNRRRAVAIAMRTVAEKARADALVLARGDS